MTRSFNYLSVLSVFGLIGFLAFVGEGFDSSVALSFGYFAYLGYIFVRPDELFWKYVLRSAAITLAVSLIFISGWVSVYYLTQAESDFIFMGFWVMYALMHVVFNVVFVTHITLDGSVA